jgi:hypothetical protein
MIDLTHLALLAIFAPLALASPPPMIRDIKGFCASEPPPGFIQASADMQEASNSSDYRAIITSITLNVYFHIVAPPTSPFTPNPPYVTEAQIASQFTVLRNAFCER